MQRLDLDEQDLTLPAGGELPHTLVSVEKFFKSPLSVPTTSKKWLDQIDQAKNSAELFGVAHKIIDPTLPEAPEPALPDLTSALAEAQTLLNRAVDSLTPEDRQLFLREMGWPDEQTGLIQQEISARRIKSVYERMEKFRQADLLAAAAIVMTAADQTVLSLRGSPQGDRSNLPFPIGKTRLLRSARNDNFILVGGPGDDVYTEQKLKNVTVLIDLGGKNTYEAPAAAAREKEIRLVIDLGTDITFRYNPVTPGSVASGRFGIGLFYAPTSSGTKEFVSGSFAQGCGIGGVGGLFINGPARLSGDQYIQGAGAFGVGILSVKAGAGSSYLAHRNGQGAGFVRGVGLFYHQGDNTVVRGGLVQPDPREPQGTVSVCQGVGFGRRAYSGGGVGIAALDGNNIEATGSYFAQGCGYWHALGLFRLRGNHSVLQARRYSLGSGVHSAFGHLEVEGNENRVLNWGVGPAYGWDRAWGSARVQGNRNEIQADWGTATAAIGSLSFSAIIGNGNRLKMPNYASGGFMNDEFAYALHTIDGEDNLMEVSNVILSEAKDLFLMPTPWGVGRMNGVKFTDDLKLAKPVWPDLPRDVERARERVDLQKIMFEAEVKAPLEKTADLLDVAAAFGLDQESPRQALEKLLSQPDEAAPFFVEILEPAATDQLIRLRIAMAAFGRPMIEAILNAYPQAPLKKKQVLLSFLSRFDPSLAMPFVFDEAFKSREERLRLSAIRATGSLLNKDTGQDPGARAAYDMLAEYLKNPKSAQKKTEDLLSRLRLAEALGILAAVTPLNKEKRLMFFKAGPKDVTETIGTNGARELARQVLLEQTYAKMKLEKIKTTLTSYESNVRAELKPLLVNTSTSTVLSAVVVLGQLGDGSDAADILPLLNHNSGNVRDASTVALARMGDQGLRFLNDVFQKKPESRRLVMAALPHINSVAATTLLWKGLRDGSPQVRLQALSVFGSLPPALTAKRKQYIKEATQILRRENDESVRLAVLLLN